MGSMVYSDADGVQRTLLWDEEQPGVFQTKTTMDLEQIIDNNAILAAEHPTRLGGNKYVARVPLTIYEQSIHEDWDENDWKRWLNDPQNAPFRIWKGRV
jgi:hypothetical protein